LHARQRCLSCLHVNEASMCTHLHPHTLASYIQTYIRMIHTDPPHILHTHTLHVWMYVVGMDGCKSVWMDGCTCVLILNVCICMYVCLCLWVYAFVALTWEARGGCAAGNVVPAPKDSQLWLWEVGTGAFPPKKPQRKKEKGGWGGGG
jgi:hypothetical protein